MLAIFVICMCAA